MIGIVRKLNQNGRLVIPIELREQYGIDAPDSLVEIISNDEGMLVRKYEPRCILCGSPSKEFEIIEDKRLRNSCLEKVRK